MCVNENNESGLDGMSSRLQFKVYCSKEVDTVLTANVLHDIKMHRINLTYKYLL